MYQTPSDTSPQVRMNGGPGLTNPALLKRANREANLAQYPDWRPDLSNGIPNDVSSSTLSRLSPREVEIVHLDATALLERIHRREYSAADVTIAHSKAAVAAQDLTNCLTEVFIEQAVQRARELDEILQQTGRVVGPLHGLPISIKDHMKIKGLDTSSGYVAWAGKTVAESDAVIVDVLRKAGAILYVKTANPQSLLSLETDNNIFGRTFNPFNRTLSPGGSSGGESALIASHGSPMGIGSDIGGSIVIPAALCGLYGLKSSVARIPHAGLMGSHDGMDNIVGALGPLARSARDLALFHRVVLGAESWLLEHAVLHMPWRDDIVKGVGVPEKLTIAVLADDGVVRPHPPLLRALENYKKALVAAGHEVIDWIPFKHRESWELLLKFYFLDGGAEYRETLAEGKEEATPSFSWILEQCGGRAYTVRETWQLNVERDRFRAQALAHWNDTQNRTQSGRPVDAILTPTFATLAPPHDSTRWWGYSSYWNLLDLPGVVFPTGERLNIGDYPETSDSLPPARNPAEEYIRNQWDPKTYEGAPVSLQLVGRRHQEEALLAILNQVEAAAKLYTKHEPWEKSSSRDSIGA